MRRVQQLHHAQAFDMLDKEVLLQPGSLAGQGAEGQQAGRPVGQHASLTAQLSHSLQSFCKQ